MPVEMTCRKRIHYNRPAANLTVDVWPIVLFAIFPEAHIDAVFFVSLAVGMVKQPTAEQSEFQMSNEDFPALPGTQIGDHSGSQPSNMQHTMNNNSAVIGGGSSVLDLGGDGKNSNHHGSGAVGAGMILSPEAVSAQDKAFKRGVQTSPDGTCVIYFS